MLWKQLDLNPEWPVSVGVAVYNSICRGVGRLILPHEQRVVANGKSPSFTVAGEMGDTWQDRLE